MSIYQDNKRPHVIYTTGWGLTMHIMVVESERASDHCGISLIPETTMPDVIVFFILIVNKEIY